MLGAKYIIQITPPLLMRYQTAGDYWKGADGTTIIEVCKQDNEDYEFLIALHELIEEHLTRKRGITEESITAFDRASTDEEPGENPNAPYHREHIFAENIERLMCAELGINWSEYNSRIRVPEKKSLTVEK